MLKIQSDLDNETIPTVKKIAAKLIEQGDSDKYFMETLNKPNKSLKEMWVYIWQEAKKLAVPIPGITGGTGVELDDDELVRMAKHYYDEDSIIISNADEDANDDEKEVEKVEEVELPDEDLDDFDF